MTLLRTRSLAVWAGVSALMLSFALNAMDRQLFYPLLGAVRTDLGLSLPQGGALATGFTLGMAAAGLPAGHLADRFPRRTVIIVSIVVYSVGTLATPFATGFTDLFGYRLLSGLGEGMQAAALFAALGAYFHRHRALVLGALVAAFGLGVFLGPLLGVAIAQATGTWRTPFYYFGFAGLVIALIILLVVRPSLTEHATRQDRAETSFDHVPASPYNRNSLLLAAVSAVGGMVFYSFLGLYPTFLQSSLDFTAGQAALATGLVGTGAAFSLLGGWLGDRLDQRRLLIGTYAMVSVTGMLLYQGPSTAGWQYFFAFLMGVFGSGFLFTNCTSALQRAVQPHHVGRAAGLFVTSYYVAAACSGLLFAALVDGIGWRAAGFWQLGALPWLGVVALVLVRTDQTQRGVRTAR